MKKGKGYPHPDFRINIVNILTFTSLGVGGNWDFKGLFTFVESGVRYSPKGIFPRATSEVSISQEATSQTCDFPSGNFTKARLGLLKRRRLQ